MASLKRLFDEILENNENVNEDELLDEFYMKAKKRLHESEPDTSLECYDVEDSSTESSDDDDDDDDVEDDYSVCSDEDVQDYIEDSLGSYNGRNERAERARLLFDPDSDMNFAKYLSEKLLYEKHAIQAEIDDLYIDGDDSYKSMKEKFVNLHTSYYNFKNLHDRIKNIYENNNMPCPELENEFLSEVMSVLTDLQNELNSDQTSFSDFNTNEDKEYYSNMYLDAVNDFETFVGRTRTNARDFSESSFGYGMSFREKFYELDRKLEERDQLVESINALEERIYAMFDYTDFLRDDIVNKNVAIVKLKDFLDRHQIAIDTPMENRQYLFHNFATIDQLNTFLHTYNDLLQETVDIIVQKGQCAINEETTLNIDPEMQEISGIAKEQQMTDLVFDKKNFARLCKEIMTDYSFDKKFDDEALEILQTAAEDYLVTLFGKTIKATIQRNSRVDIPYETNPRDMNFIINLNNE